MLPRNHSETVGEFLITTVVNTPPWYENCYVVCHRSTGRQFVIDPGGEAERIAAVVRANAGGYSPAADKVEILLTHGHPDHLGGVHDLQALIDMPCRAHQDEQPIISAAANWSSALMQRQINDPKRLEYFTGQPVFSYEGFEIRVVSTPGHTPGGVCFIFGGFVFTGDTLFNQGVGRTDLPGGNGHRLSDSITRLLGGLDDEAALLFSGHGPSWAVAEARAWWGYARNQGFL